MKHTLLYILLLVAICPLWAQDSSKAADGYIRFYQKHISEQKNSHCAMYPSCSAFGRMVFKERPFAEAITLVADRMMRCSHDAKFYDIASPHGYRSLIDYPYYHTPPPPNRLPPSGRRHTETLNRKRRHTAIHQSPHQQKRISDCLARNRKSTLLQSAGKRYALCAKVAVPPSHARHGKRNIRIRD